MHAKLQTHSPRCSVTTRVSTFLPAPTCTIAHYLPYLLSRSAVLLWRLSQSQKLI